MSVPAYSPSADAQQGTPPVRSGVVEATSETFRVWRSEVSPGNPFGSHVHEDDQLAWMARGSVELEVRGESWRLRGDQLVWIPAGVPHAMEFPEPGTLVSLYAHPTLRPAGEGWARPRVLGSEPLTAATLEHLAGLPDAAVEGAADVRRRRVCHELLVDLLAGAVLRHDVVALPRDPRARAVALGVLADPADARGLPQWADVVGVGARTIARAFVAETGTTFRRWRIQARLHAGAGQLLAGATVHEVSERVGYATPSGFIAAFAERFGSTPAQYARANIRPGRGAPGVPAGSRERG